MASITDNEKEWLREMTAGSREAFTRLYERHWESMFTTAAKVLRSRDDAADVVQDVFLSLWNRRSTLQIEGSLLAYLQTSVRYKSIHYIEKNITRRDYLAMLTDTAALQETDDPVIHLQLKQIQAAIHESVAQMPPKMREVFELSRQEDLSHREIAVKLGISEDTVKKHIQRALAQLREAIRKNPGAVTAVLSFLFDR